MGNTFRKDIAVFHQVPAKSVDATRFRRRRRKADLRSPSGDDPTRTLASPYPEASHARFNGRRPAERRRPVFVRETFKLVLGSLMQWSREPANRRVLATRPLLTPARSRSTRARAGLADLPRRMRRLAGPGGCAGRAGDSPDGGVALFAIGTCRVCSWALDRGAGGCWAALPAGYGHAVRPRLLPLHSRREGMERTSHRLAPKIGREVETGRMKQ